MIFLDFHQFVRHDPVTYSEPRIYRNLQLELDTEPIAKGSKLRLLLDIN